MDEKLIPKLKEATNLAIDLFGDEYQGRTWMCKQNEYFFGRSPKEECLLGNAHLVIALLKERAGL